MLVRLGLRNPKIHDFFQAGPLPIRKQKQRFQWYGHGYPARFHSSVLEKTCCKPTGTVMAFNSYKWNYSSYN